MNRALVLIAAAACGGTASPPPKPAEPVHKTTRVPIEENEPDDGVDVIASHGHMDPAVVDAGIDPHRDELSDCYVSRVGKRRWLGGKVELTWDITKDAQVTAVRVASSDLGAWPVEKCLLDISRGMSFDKPKGGATDFSLPLEFIGKQSSTWWDEEVGANAVKNHVKDLAKCEKAGSRAPEDATITAYVGARGKVVSVGFSTAQDAGLDADTWDAWADCAEKRILAWQLPDPRGSIAKLAFHYPR